MKRTLILTLNACVAVLSVSTVVGESSAGQSTGDAAHGLDPVVLAGVAVILIIAKLGSELFERLGQPTVLGELIAGVVLGNLTASRTTPQHSPIYKVSF